jgi:hypothetical protein
MIVRFMLTAVLAAGLASAQRGGAGLDEGAGARAGGRGAGPPPVQRLTKQEMLFEKLKLTKEQKEEATRILSTAMESAASMRELLTKGRIVIANAITDNASEGELRSALDEYTSIDANMMAIEADAFGKLLALLKPNQTSKAPQAFELLAEVFAGPGPGGPGGGSGRGRGEGGR